VTGESQPGVPDGEDHQLMDDLFHALSQPLTTLRCGLGLSLQHSSGGKQLRRDLEIALQAAESVSWLVAGIRELTEATSPSPTGSANLHECLRKTLDDLEPLARSAQLRLSLVSNVSMEVKMEPSRLRQALLYLLEFIWRSSPGGSEMTITMVEETEHVVLTFQGPLPPPARETCDLKLRVAWAIASRIFRAAAGSVHLQADSSHCFLKVELPRAVSQTVSSTASRCCA
jgi:hypothetical protein